MTRAELDLTDGLRVDARLRALKPDLVIHCAALSRTKACEQDPELARRINVEATARLANLCRDIPFIFLSSGEVFDGKTGWYDEADEAVSDQRLRPNKARGRTGRLAESEAYRAAHRADRGHFAQRRSKFCGRYVPNRRGRKACGSLCRRVSLSVAGRRDRESHLGIGRSGTSGPLSSGRARAALALGDRTGLAPLVSGTDRPSGRGLRARSCRGSETDRSVASLRQDPEVPLLSHPRIPRMAYRTFRPRSRPVGLCVAVIREP
jgi:hypothetical protein